MVEVTLVTQTYKRPQYAERLLDLVEEFTPFVDSAVVGYIVEGDYSPKERDWQVKWVELSKCNRMEGRNRVMKKAEDLFDTDVAWLTDDDVKPNQYTDFREVIPKVVAVDTGTVTITRDMAGNNPSNHDDTLRENLPYIGGGYLIEPKKFFLVDGFDEEDAADEKAFGLSLYLKGFVNYRTRKAYAVHEQDAGEGGLRQSLKDGGVVQGSKLLDSEYIEIDESKAKYGGNTISMVGGSYSFTEKAKKLHKKNNGILNGEYNGN